MSREQKSLQVIARSPFEVHYEGDALSVSATNRVGNFDVLPGHADFFSMLLPCTVLIETTSGIKEIPISNGIITVRDDVVMLFVDM